MDRLDRIKELVEKKTKEEEIAYKLASLEEKEREEILAQVEREDPELAKRLRKRIEEEKKESFDELVRKPMDIGSVITLALSIPFSVVVIGAMFSIFLEMGIFTEFPMALFIMVFNVVFFAVLLSAGLYTYFKYTRKIPKKLDRIARKLQK